MVDPSLNRFDFTCICSRYLDSNGYSLRSGGADLRSRVRLRLRQQGRNYCSKPVSSNNGPPLWSGEPQYRGETAMVS